MQTLGPHFRTTETSSPGEFGERSSLQPLLCSSWELCNLEFRPPRCPLILRDCNITINKINKTSFSRPILSSTWAHRFLSDQPNPVCFQKNDSPVSRGFESFKIGPWQIFSVSSPKSSVSPSSWWVTMYCLLSKSVLKTKTLSKESFLTSYIFLLKQRSY